MKSSQGYSFGSADCGSGISANAGHCYRAAPWKLQRPATIPGEQGSLKTTTIFLGTDKVA